MPPWLDKNVTSKGFTKRASEENDNDFVVWWAFAIVLPSLHCFTFQINLALLCFALILLKLSKRTDTSKLNRQIWKCSNHAIWIQYDLGQVVSKSTSHQIRKLSVSNMLFEIFHNVTWLTSCYCVKYINISS
jgi:hypothetical protein